MQGQKKAAVASILVKERRENTFLMAAKIVFFDLVADCGQVFSVKAFPRPNVDLDVVSSVHQNNLTRSEGLVERDNVVGQAE